MNELNTYKNKPSIGTKVDFFYKGKIYPAIVTAHCGYDFFYIEFTDISPSNDNPNISDTPGWYVSMRSYKESWDFHMRGEDNMQNGVDICTKDSDLNINYGLMDLRPERELARASVRYILTDMNDIRRQYIRLGFHLHEFNHMKYYEDFGYATMEEFCDKNFGLDKTTVSRCINVFLEFSRKEHYEGGLKKGACSFVIDDRWKEYSYSQLVEMLPLTDEQRRMVKPEMSIRQIREFKKSQKKVSASVATSQQDVKYSDTYCKGLQGIVRQQYYKKCKGRSTVIDIVDDNGKPIEGIYNTIAIVLENNGGHIVIRLIEHHDEEKPGE